MSQTIQSATNLSAIDYGAEAVVVATFAVVVAVVVAIHTVVVVAAAQ